MQCRSLVADECALGAFDRFLGGSIVGTEPLTWRVKWPDLPCQYPFPFMSTILLSLVLSLLARML